MIQGQDLSVVAKQIVADQEHKRDYLAQTEALEMIPTGGKGQTIRFKLNKKKHEFEPTAICLGQISDRVGIPRKYADRLMESAPDLFAKNVNHWFQAAPERRMLRTLQNGMNTARAFLSDRYRPLDNADIAEKILPKLSDMGMEIRSCAVTETRLYIQAVNPRIQGEVKKVGDVVQSGLTISNSEVGMGSLLSQHLIYTLRCTNGMVSENIIKQHHLGRKGTGGYGNLEEAEEFMSDETRKIEDKAFWMKVGDLLDHTLSREKFDAIVNRLNDVASVDLEKPLEVVEMLSERFIWQKDEKESVLKHLIRGGDLTQYGMIQAVTRTAEDCTSYDRGVEFEKQGGQVMLMKAHDFDV